jgi:1,4-alpha-glucan branching enzyme
MNHVKPFALILTGLFCFILRSHSQVITTIPAYPTDIDSCTVIFDATQGDGGLKDVSPPIYAHTGVITNLSTSGSDWKYVIAGWNENLLKAEMTPLGNNQYRIVLKPSIREFYGVPASETIERIAFVFRNSDGSKTGRETNGGDIYADVFSSSFKVDIIKPSNKELYVSHNELIPVEAASLQADSMMIYLNEILIKKDSGMSITDTLEVDASVPAWQKQWVKILAKNDTAERADSFSYVVVPEPETASLPDGMTDGINYVDSTEVVLSLYAPGKRYCFALGDFNDWKIDSSSFMSRTPDGSRYWMTIKNLEPRKEYIFQYLVDGVLRIADPYSDKVSDPNDKYISTETYPNLIPYPEDKTTGIASCLQTAQDPYPWEVSAFSPPKITDLVIYELLIRDFISKHDYPSLIDTLGYLKRLGVNAIELMPVMEFEGNSSWGYNPDFMFAPDKYYGTKNGLKQFIEAAHKQGIAVILDIVLNHQFGSSPLVRLYWDSDNNRPAEDNPWFDPIPKHPYSVGYDFNHESPQTSEFCNRVLKYWIDEYHVDGYRFDLSKGFTQKDSYPDNVSLWGQYDANRITTLKKYDSVIQSVKPGAYLILEHFAENTEEKELSSYGMLLWGNLNYNYNQATMGWNTSSDFSWISYKNRGWSQPNLVGYMESHDEERLAFNDIKYGNSSNIDYNVKDTATSLKRLGMAAAFFYTIPGPKMLWQFGELGYDYSINYPSGTSDSRLSPKPIRWDYYDQWVRKYLYNVVASLIDLKKNQDVFESTDYTLSLSASCKKINLNSPSMDVTVIGNFDVVSGNINPTFQKTGNWYDYFSGDSIAVSNVSDPITLQPGEYHIYTSVKLPKPLFTGIADPQPGENPGKEISMVYPNPSQGDFNIRIDLKNQASVTIKIYDMTGRLIRVITDQFIPAGMHTFTWDGRDTRGIRTSPGLYFYEIRTGNFSERKKLIVN